jgi:ABC-type transport system substrate-binding protein
MPDLLASVEKVDDYTVRFVLNQPEAPFLANLAMDFASIMSLEHAEADDGSRHAGRDRPAPRRHRAVPAGRLSAGRHHPLPRTRTIGRHRPRSTS